MSMDRRSWRVLKIDTRHFGEIEVDDSKVVVFKSGIFGFEKLTKYVVLYDNTESESPFAWLQSVEDKDVSLPMVNPMLWFPSYAPEVDDELIATIGDPGELALEVYSVVVIPEDVKKMTTNLRAPILLNQTTKTGIQVIVNDEEYEIKHNLYEQFEKLKEAGE